MTNLIGLSGRKQSGKNTVATMIQYLTGNYTISYKDYTIWKAKVNGDDSTRRQEIIKLKAIQQSQILERKNIQQVRLTFTLLGRSDFYISIC